MKFLGFQHAKGIFSVTIYNKKKDILNNYFIQFSLKFMWKKPHKDYRFNNNSWVFGWGFLFFGNIIAKN